MDKLLECAEVNFRTLCDLIRYHRLKDAGVVNSVDESLRLSIQMMSAMLRKRRLIKKISRPGKKTAGSAARLNAQALDRDLLTGGVHERVSLQKL